MWKISKIENWKFLFKGFMFLWAVGEEDGCFCWSMRRPGEHKPWLACQLWTKRIRPLICMHLEFCTVLCNCTQMVVQVRQLSVCTGLLFRKESENWN